MIEAKKKELAVFKLYKKYPHLNCLKDVKKIPSIMNKMLNLIKEDLILTEKQRIKEAAKAAKNSG